MKTSKIGKALRCLLAAATAMSLSSCAAGRAPREPAAEKPEIQLSDYAPLGQADMYAVVAENARYQLLFGPATCTVAVRSRETGYTWKSNLLPGDYDTSVSTDILDEYQSQFRLTFYNDRGREETYNSYRHSVAEGRVTIYSIENGVRVVYNVDESQPDRLFPDVISQSTLEQEILPKLEPEEQERVLQYYVLNDYAQQSDANKKLLAEKYPLVVEEPVYLPIKAHISIRKSVAELFEKAGLTLDGLNAEYQKVGYDKVLDKTPNFEIPVDYRLTEDGMSAHIQVDEITYDTSNFYLTNIDLLPYFGCGMPGEEGYMLVPDGSGALIDFASTSQNSVAFPVYGSDPANEQEDYQHGRQATLPVFGVNKGDNGFLALITQGDAQATIQCDPANSVIQHPTVYPTFEVLRKEVYSSDNLLAEAEMVRYAKKGYTGSIEVEYMPLSGEDSGYAGMASMLREKLFGDGQPDAGAALGLYIDTYGVVTGTDRVLGLEVEKARALTTYAQAQQMLADLQGAGIQNIRLRYRNWSHDVNKNSISKLGRVSGLLGGKQDLSSLLLFAGQAGIQVFADNELLHDVTGGFSSSNAKKVSGDPAEYWKPGIAYEVMEEDAPSFYVKNPLVVKKRLPDVLADMQKLGFQHLALPSFADSLSSDYNEKALMTRSDVRDEIVHMLQSCGDFTLMGDVGNWYTLPYLDAVMDIPMSGSRLLIEKQSVPFLQIVLHGYVDYAGEPLNLSDDYRSALLKAVEYGGHIRYSLNAAQPESVKGTLYNDLYSTNFDYWKDRVAADFAEAASVLDGLQNQRIVDHASVTDTLMVTRYEDGTEIVVNYGSEAVVYKNQSVAAQGFCAIR